MAYLLVGLGNPGTEYENTRHNAGRLALANWAKTYQKTDELSDWKLDKISQALKASGEVAGEKVTLLLPETFMNKSGTSLKDKIKNPKQAEKLIVIHDDLDLPLGTLKISFNRGSGGHKGLESVIRAVKTKAFVRVRIGICPTTPSGKPKKPDADKILDFIIGQFKPVEAEVLKKVFKQSSLALGLLVSEGREKAMGEIN
jgi:PTH1 family peptidyl-tRNA hydrolase